MMIRLHDVTHCAEMDADYDRILKLTFCLSSSTVERSELSSDLSCSSSFSLSCLCRNKKPPSPPARNTPRAFCSQEIDSKLHRLDQIWKNKEVTSYFSTTHSLAVEQFFHTQRRCWTWQDKDWGFTRIRPTHQPGTLQEQSAVKIEQVKHESIHYQKKRQLSVRRDQNERAKLYFEQLAGFQGLGCQRNQPKELSQYWHQAKASFKDQQAIAGRCLPVRKAEVQSDSSSLQHQLFTKAEVQLTTSISSDMKTRQKGGGVPVLQISS